MDIEDEEERARYVDGVRQFDFDAGLGPYPYDKYP